MAKIVATHVRKRGFFGFIFKWLFIGFNILMGVWLWAYWSDISEMMAKEESLAAQAGGTIGTMLGTGALLVIWGAGAAVFGGLALATRGKKVTTHETIP